MLSYRAKPTIALRAVSVVLIWGLLLSGESSYAITDTASDFALAPPIFTKSPCEIVQRSDGTWDVETNNDVIESQGRETAKSVMYGGGGVRENIKVPGYASRNRWAFVEVGILIGQMLVLTQKHELKNPKEILIPLIRKHIRNRNGEAEILLEGYDIDAIEEVRDGQAITGFSLPVIRNGTPAYQFIYNLQGGDTSIPMRDDATIYVKKVEFITGLTPPKKEITTRPSQPLKIKNEWHLGNKPKIEGIPSDEMEWLGTGVDSAVYKYKDSVYKAYTKLTPEQVERYRHFIDTVRIILEKESGLDKVSIGNEQYLIHYAVMPIKDIFKDMNGVTVAKSDFAPGIRLALFNQTLESDEQKVIDKSLEGMSVKKKVIFEEILRGVTGRNSNNIGLILYQLSQKNKSIMDTTGFVRLELGCSANTSIDVDFEKKEICLIVTDIADNIDLMLKGSAVQSIVTEIPIAVSSSSERINATNLQDTLTYIQAQPQTQPLIVALGTSWIKGYEKDRYLQYDALNPLIGSIRTYCESRGIQFIVDDDDKLLARINAERAKEGRAGAKVVVLADKNTAVSDEFTALRNDQENAFVVGVDSQELTTNSYIRLIEMLTLALKLSEGLEMSLDNAHMTITKDNERHLYIFLPHAEPMDYEQLKMIYEVQKFA